jgi:hypothetical protein
MPDVYPRAQNEACRVSTFSVRSQLVPNVANHGNDLIPSERVAEELELSNH